MNTSARRASMKTLTGLGLGEMVEVREVPLELTSSSLSGSNLRRGEVVQCLGHNNGDVIVARADGSRSSIPAGLGRAIYVRPFELYESPDILLLNVGAGQQTGGPLGGAQA